MTNDELDELMIKAGLRFGYPFSRSHLVNFSKLVALKERERVAQIILNGRFLHDESPAAQFAKEVAAAIRAME